MRDPIETLMVREDDDDVSVLRVMAQCIPILILGFIIPIAAYHSILMPGKDSAPVWFQRSGAICVALAVWVEYQLLTIQHVISPSGVVRSSQAQTAQRYGPKAKVLQYFVVSLAIVGTVIWAYGDLFWNWANAT